MRASPGGSSSTGGEGGRERGGREGGGGEGGRERGEGGREGGRKGGGGEVTRRGFYTRHSGEVRVALDVHVGTCNYRQKVCGT